MPFIPALNVAQCSLRYTCAGPQVENTLYFRFVSDPDTGDLQNLADYLVTWRDQFLKPIQGAHCFFREVYAASLTTAFSPTVTAAVPTPVPGTYGGTPLPNNATIAVSFRTAGRGRSSRGRNYAVGLTETALSSLLGQNVQPLYAASLITAYSEFFVNLPTGWSWVVISRTVNGLPRADALVQTVTDVVLTDTTIDSQRRRLPGRGT